MTRRDGTANEILANHSTKSGHEFHVVLSGSPDSWDRNRLMNKYFQRVKLRRISKHVVRLEYLVKRELLGHEVFD